MNIYDRLEKDHERQRALADRLVATSGDSEERRELFSRFCVELEAHAAAEEQTLYAALIATSDGQDQARHSIAEHKDAADLVKELQETSMSTGAWLQKFEQLKHDVLHHLDEEENDVFPLARKLIDDSVIEKLAFEFDDRKRQEREALV